MATYAQRIAAIADAVLNTTATNAQKDRLGRALAARVGRVGEYAAATNADKAQIAVSEIRHILIGLIREAEGGEAAKTASNAVDDGFTEQP